MSVSLASISKGTALKAPRIFLGGTEGVGKSTLASQAPNPIFIPMQSEQGLDQIDTNKFPPASSHAEVMESLRVLYQEDHDFQTVVIDSVSALEPLVWKAVCAEHGVDGIEKVLGGFGKGYTESLKYWRELMTALDYLRDDKGMACILIGHVKTKEFADPEAESYTTYTMDLNEKAANAIIRWADGVFFANFKRAIVSTKDAGFGKSRGRGTSTGQRVVYTEKRAAHFGKNRYAMPYELPMSWSEIGKYFVRSTAGGKVGEPTPTT